MDINEYETLIQGDGHKGLKQAMLPFATGDFPRLSAGPGDKELK